MISAHGKLALCGGRRLRKVSMANAVTDFATGDFETDPFGKNPDGSGRIPGDGMEVFAACYYEEEKPPRVWWGKNAARDFVRHAMKRHKICYLHNGGKFDDHFAFETILDVLADDFGLHEQTLHCIGKRIVSIPTPTADFRDSYALIPKPLAAIGAKKEIEIWKLEKAHREKHRHEITEYMVTDTVELHKGVSDFIRINGQALTLATVAFKELQTKFGVEPMKTDERFDDLFRPAFFAGRVQFFSLGKHGELDGKSRFKICDINSAFPWSMTGTHWFSANYLSVESAPRKFRDQCLFDVTCDSRGALPIRKRDGGVDFPQIKAGRFLVFGHELWTAKRLGLVSAVKVHAIFQPSAVRDFAEFVLHNYELKKNAKDKAERDSAKLKLNSAYGKYALNPRGFTDVVLTRYGHKPTPKQIKVTESKAKELKLYHVGFAKIGGQKKPLWQNRNKRADEMEWQYVKDGGEIYRLVFWDHIYDDMKRGLSFWSSPSDKPMTFYNVATAASITSRVRAFLMESMHACKGVMYCDTDSVIARDVSALKLGDGLGEWKLEMDCDAVWIGGKKLYVAHSINDKGVTKKPEKFYIEVKHGNYHRFFVTKKDFQETWKTAAKGVRLKVEDLIAVCEGETRTHTFDAPNLSPFSPPTFITRTVRRADQQKKRKSHD